MIYVTKETYIPSVNETLGTLRMHNQMMPQFADFDKVMMYINYFQRYCTEIGKELFDYIGVPAKKEARPNMVAWLERNEDTSGFFMGKEGISLSEESIASAIETGGLSPLAEELLDLYQKYSSARRSKTTMLGLLQNPISDHPSCDGHRMLMLRPEWHPQNTGRVAMRHPAIQNWPRELQDVLTVPLGYVLCHTDSGQIEPRLTYSNYVTDKQIVALINLYNDAYFGVLHYCTMPESDIVSGKVDFIPMEITDELKSKRQSIKTYGNAVMYGSKSNVKNDPIKAAMIKRIGEHPSRLKLVEERRQAIRRGEIIFRTVFGTPIDITKSPKLEGGRYESKEDQMLKLAINNPIQGTAADLMRLSVYEANKILMNKTKKSFIISYIHDAGCFAIHEDELHKVKDEIGTVVSYQVDGWIPIHAEPEFGRNRKSGLIPDLY